MNAPLNPAQLRPASHALSLDDKYTLSTGTAFMSGVQALVRLPMLQRVRDLAAGKNTAGFISGYRGSPLGMLDEALWKAQKHLDAHHVKFVPGVNEDLAATAIWTAGSRAASETLLTTALIHAALTHDRIRWLARAAAKPGHLG